jgi:hypothetical protein
MRVAIAHDRNPYAQDAAKYHRNFVSALSLVHWVTDRFAEAVTVLPIAAITML